MIAKAEVSAPQLERKSQRAPLIFGLLLSLLNPTILVLLAKYAGLGMLGGELFFWSMALLLIALVLLWEKRSLATMGFKRLPLKDLAWGVGLGAMIVLVFPVAFGLATFLQLEISTTTLEALGKVPVPFLFILALRAGVTEEIIYRGYAMERLLSLTNSKVVAAVLPLLVFIVSHLSWGLGHLVFVSLAGGLVTLFYLWKRNLWLNILGHTLADFVLFLLIPYWV